LNSHPEILDCAIFGLPDDNDTGNDLPSAYVVRKGNSLSEEDVKKFVAANAADYKQLRGGVSFVDRIQKVRFLVYKAYQQSPTGKIMRKEIREHALASRRTKGVSMSR
jgi:4-coumarate--CoA ligase